MKKIVCLVSLVFSFLLSFGQKISQLPTTTQNMAGGLTPVSVAGTTYAGYQPVVDSTIAELSSTPGNYTAIYHVLGSVSPGDGWGGDFYWDPNSVASPVANFVIQVTGVTTGRYIRSYYLPKAYYINGLNAINDSTVGIGGPYTQDIHVSGSLLRNWYFDSTTVYINGVAVWQQISQLPTTTLPWETTINWTFPASGSGTTYGITPAQFLPNAYYPSGLTAINDSTVYLGGTLLQQTHLNGENSFNLFLDSMSLYITNYAPQPIDTTDFSVMAISKTTGKLEPMNWQVASGSGNQFGSGIVLSGSQNIPAWGTAGPLIQVAALTLTDNSSSGTVGSEYANTFAAPTLVASSATTYSQSATLYVSGSPISSTHVTQTNSYAAYFNGNVTVNGQFSTGNTTGASNLGVGGATSTNGSGAAALTFGGGTLAYYRVALNGTTSSSIGTGDVYGNLIVGSSPVTTASSGSIAWLTQVAINPLGTVTNGGVTPTNTTSLYVGAASAAGTTNYSAYINGPLSVQGSLYFNPTFVSATGTYNMTATDAFVIFTGSTATVVYPTAFNGRAFYLVNQASGSVTLPTTTSGNGATTTTLSSNSKDFIMYDGTNSVWRIIGN